MLLLVLVDLELLLGLGHRLHLMFPVGLELLEDLPGLVHLGHLLLLLGLVDPEHRLHLEHHWLPVHLWHLWLLLDLLGLVDPEHHRHLLGPELLELH